MGLRTQQSISSPLPTGMARSVSKLQDVSSVEMAKSIGEALPQTTSEVQDEPRTSTQTQGDPPKVRPEASFEGSQLTFPTEASQAQTGQANAVSEVFQIALANPSSIPDDMTGRMTEVMKKLPEHLRTELPKEISKLMTPEAIALMAGVAGAYGAAHATGAPFIADTITAGIVGAGALALGIDAVKVGQDLKEAFVATYNAKSDKDLDRAAEHLSKAISLAGVDTLLTFASVKGSQLVKSGAEFGRVRLTRFKGNLTNTKNYLASFLPEGFLSSSRAKIPKVVSWTHPNGSVAKVMQQGDVHVDLNKINLYARGKAKPYTKEMEQEFRSLKRLKQTDRKAFDSSPANKARIKELPQLKHNYERSKAMSEVLIRAGLKDTPANNSALIRHLLEAGEQVSKNNPTSKSVFSGPKGDISIEAKWRVLEDGKKYLSTIIMVPKF